MLGNFICAGASSMHTHTHRRQQFKGAAQYAERHATHQPPSSHQHTMRSMHRENNFQAHNAQQSGMRSAYNSGTEWRRMVCALAQTGNWQQNCRCLQRMRFIVGLTLFLLSFGSFALCRLVDCRWQPYILCVFRANCDYYTRNIKMLAHKYPQLHTRTHTFTIILYGWVLFRQFLPHTFIRQLFV